MRIPSLMLSAALLLTFSGCAAESAQNPPAEVIYDVREIERTPLNILTNETNLFPLAAADFTADSSNESIKLSLIPSGEDPVHTLQTMLTSGQIPDLIYFTPGTDHGIYQTLAANDALSDLSSFFAGEDAPELYDGFLDGPVARAYDDERITGAPIDYMCAGLIVKEDLFTDEDSFPQTLDDYLALADENLLGYPQDQPAYLEPLILPLIGTNETLRLTSQDFSGSSFSSDEMKTLAESLSSMSSKIYSNTPYADMDDVCTAFVEGTVFSIPCDASIAEILYNEYGLEDKTLLLPSPSVNGTQYLLTMVSPAYIPVDAPHSEEALRFLAQLYRTESTEGAGSIPPVKGSSELLSGFRGAAATLFENGITAYCGDFTFGLSAEDELYQKVYTATGELISGSITSDEWIDTMNSLFES